MLSPTPANAAAAAAATAAAATATAAAAAAAAAAAGPSSALGASAHLGGRLPHRVLRRVVQESPSQVVVVVPVVRFKK